MINLIDRYSVVNYIDSVPISIRLKIMKFHSVYTMSYQFRKAMVVLMASSVVLDTLLKGFNKIIDPHPNSVDGNLK